jgi:hypothetical protein
MRRSLQVLFNMSNKILRNAYQKEKSFFRSTYEDNKLTNDLPDL